VMVISFGPGVSDADVDGNTQPPSTLHRTTGIIVRLVGLGLLVVVLHDLYYVVNMAAITISYNTGAQLIQATVRGDSREYLRDSLTPHRWQHAIVLSRPTRWVLADEVAEMNQANLEFLDFLSGKGIQTDESRSDWKGKLKDGAITALWRSDNPFAKKIH
jgi:hypothetical protein